MSDPRCIDVLGADTFVLEGEDCALGTVRRVIQLDGASTRYIVGARDMHNGKPIWHRMSEPSPGFTAGVITVTWTAEPPIEITGREGRMYTANIEIDARYGLRRDVGTKALVGLVVRAPDGSLARVAGVESFATHGLIGPIGLLLVAMEER